MKQRFRWLVLLLLVGALGLWTSSKAAGDTLVIAQGVDAVTLDPRNTFNAPTGVILTNIFDTMYRRLADASLVPWLVTAKAVSSTTWDLTVRSGVKFHNGEALDAEVIKFNFDRITDPSKPLVFSGLFTNIAKTEVTGPMTLRITTKVPLPTFLGLLSIFSVMPKGYLTQEGNAYLQKAIGTGPYRFVKWVKDQSFELEANPDYWGGAPKIKKVIFRPIPEISSR